MCCVGYDIVVLSFSLLIHVVMLLCFVVLFCFSFVLVMNEYLSLSLLLLLSSN